MFTLRRLAVVTALVLWGVATHSTHAGSGDEPHYLAIAHSLAFDFDLDLTNNYGRSEPLIADGGLVPGAHLRPGRDGRARPVHDIGLPLMFAPYVRLVRPLAERAIPHSSGTTMRRLRLTPTTLYRHLLSAAMILVAVALAVMMARSFADVGASQTVAALTALLIAASPPLLVMSLLFFTEVPSALVCLAAFRVVTSAAPLTVGRATIAGSLLGLLILLHVRNVGIVAALLMVGGWRLRQDGTWRSAAAFGSGVVLLVAVRASLTYALWGSFWTSPHAAAGVWTGLADTVPVIAVRGGGLLLDQEYGLLPYAPTFVLAPIGLWVIARQRRFATVALTTTLTLYVALILLPLTNVHGWTGGWSPAGRFLTPILPLAAIGVAAAIATLPRLVTLPVIVLQIVISGYIWQNPKNLWNDGDGTSAACSRGGMPICRYLPSFVTPADFQQSR